MVVDYYNLKVTSTLHSPDRLDHSLLLNYWQQEGLFLSLDVWVQNELKGSPGVKGEKGEPGGYYDPRYGGSHGVPGPPVRSKMIILHISIFFFHHVTF